MKISLIQPLTTLKAFSPTHELLYSFFPVQVSQLDEKRVRLISNLPNEIIREIILRRTGTVSKWPIPYSLLCIAAYLERFGHDVNVVSLDYERSISNKENLAQSQWLRRILKEKIHDSSIVGTTCTTPQYYDALEILKTAKTINPNIDTVLGGPHVSYQDLETIRKNYVDFVVRGEGEESILDLTEAVEKRSKIEKVRGITFKKGRKIKRNPDRPLINLTILPIPAYHLLPRHALTNSVVFTLFSRGCPYRCAYCSEGSFWKNKVRFRSTEGIIRELEFMRERFPHNIIHFADSEFGLFKKQTELLCDAIRKSDLDLFFSCNVRPDFARVGPSIAKKMYETGFIEFLVGIESASSIVLKKVHRELTFAHALTTCEMMKEIGIPFVRTYWINGLPGETHNTAMQSAKKLDQLYKRDLIYDSIHHVFVPYPGTEAFHFPERYGIRILSHNWRHYARYDFPLTYRLDELDQLEIMSYFILMGAIQLKHYATKMGLENGFYKKLESIWKIKSSYLDLVQRNPFLSILKRNGKFKKL